MNEIEKQLKAYSNGYISDITFCAGILGSLKPGDAEKYLPLVPPNILAQLRLFVVPKDPSEVLQFGNESPTYPVIQQEVRAWLEKCER